MRFARPLLMLLRVLAGIQVVLGIGFWTGHWIGLRNLHMGLGSLFVLTLLAIAVIALAGKRAQGLAVFTIVWGIVIAGFGAMQTNILIGDYHWIVRVLHLVIALAAIPMAERLVRTE